MADINFVWSFFSLGAMTGVATSAYVFKRYFQCVVGDGAYFSITFFALIPPQVLQDGQGKDWFPLWHHGSQQPAPSHASLLKVIVIFAAITNETCLCSVASCRSFFLLMSAQAAQAVAIGAFVTADASMLVYIMGPVRSRSVTPSDSKLEISPW